MKRSEAFLRNRDIPWAVRMGDYYIYVSSAGDNLPEIVESQLFAIWRKIKKLKVIYKREEINLNEKYLNSKFNANLNENHEDNLAFFKEWYIHSFVAMARRGFYAFDRDINTPIKDSIYHLIAYPPQVPKITNDILPYIQTDNTPMILEGTNIVSVVNQYFLPLGRNLKRE